MQSLHQDKTEEQKIEQICSAHTRIPDCRSKRTRDNMSKRQPYHEMKALWGSMLSYTPYPPIFETVG